jgi:hypothetical protein
MMSRFRLFSALLTRAVLAVGIAFTMLVAASFGGLVLSAHAASTLVVTTTADSSTCTAKSFTLRCAINQANTDGSGDTITFNIPSTDPGCTRQTIQGSSVFVCTIGPIDVFNSLPQLTAKNTIINGYTQPGARPNTNPLSAGDNAILTISINVGAQINALTIGGTGDTIKGLDFINFNTAIITADTGSVTVQGNFIGLASDGSTSGTSGTGVEDNSTGGLVIGGTAPADSNVISGNSSDAAILGTKDTFQGNIVGLNAAGNKPIFNGLAGDIQTGGLIIGSGDLIGGTTTGAGNVISGNDSGIRVFGNSSLIEGNLIGTDVTGKKAIGNEEGITFQGNIGAPVNNNTIGGLVTAARNIISGNFNFGIDMGEGSGNVVEGNYIGTDITGEVALSNGGKNGATAQNSAGLLLSTSFNNTSNNTIGGTTSAARNVISGNAFSGVQISVNDIRGGTGSTENNLFEGNFIGLDAAGTKALGNGTNGVFVASTSGGSGQILNNSIKGNVIAHNGQSGILVGLSATDTAVHTPISQNSTFANGGLGIDLAPQGVVNTATNPPGPNDYIHAPVITQANTAQVSGTAPANATVEVFIASNEANDHGHGEGQTFLASTTANATGNWSLSLPSGKVTSGQVLTATATMTGSSAETSEFAANLKVL